MDNRAFGEVFRRSDGYYEWEFKLKAAPEIEHESIILCVGPTFFKTEQEAVDSFQFFSNKVGLGAVNNE